MKSLKKTVMAMVLLLSVAFANAQINNAKTGIVKIFGNCGMCEAKIEKAGNLANIAIVDWDKDSKLASITYDSAKTNQEEILKRIAFSGYDSEKILAPDEAYNKLPGCCQYERQEKAVVNKEIAEMDNGHGHEDN
jgi:copper chaperone CopZ